MFGIGTDIIEVARVKKAIQKGRFLTHVFTDTEIAYCKRFKDPHPHYAGRFAAKEAVMKAFGTGLSGGISWHDIEIVNEESGKPLVNLSKKFPKKLNAFVSISHTKEYAMAMCVITC